MLKAVKYVTFIDIVFVLLLAISGLFQGITERILYYTAFLLPIILGIFLMKKADTEVFLPKIKISKEGAFLTVPLIFPTLLFIFAISWVTSLILSKVGGGNVPDVSGNIILVLLSHAAVPAILEECLFRYIPIALILPHSKKWAVLISALFFSLIHCNLYQIPYAFFAGVVFAVLDITTGSILPSAIIHFLNNVISVFWIRLSGNVNFALIYIMVLIFASLISVIFIALKRKKYKSSFSFMFSDKSKLKLSYEPILFVVMMFVIAFANLLGR